MASIKAFNSLRFSLACTLTVFLTVGHAENLSITKKPLDKFRSNIPLSNPQSLKIQPQSDEFEIRGKVTDEAGDPIAYVNIGIPGTSVGTISGKEGKFQINIPASRKNDTLKFSAIGYQSQFLSVNQAKQKVHFILREKVYEYDAVTVKGEKADYKTKKLGGWKPIWFGSYHGYSNEGCKIVKRMEMDKDKAYIQKVRIWIKKNKDTTYPARVRIYDKKGGKPNKSLLKESLIKTVPAGKTWMVYDVSDQNIVVSNDFYVGIEFLEASKPGKGPYIGAKFNDEPQKSWQRFFPYKKWKQSDDNYVMQAIVSYRDD